MFPFRFSTVAEALGWRLAKACLQQRRPHHFTALSSLLWPLARDYVNPDGPEMGDTSDAIGCPPTTVTINS